MTKKIRKIIDGEVQWFGRGNAVKYSSPMLEITDTDSYIEAYKYRIYNLLNIIRGELLDKTYGIKSIFGKYPKEDIDIEIRQALNSKLDLVVNEYKSTIKDRGYYCSFTVTTPKGSTISLEMFL